MRVVTTLLLLAAALALAGCGGGGDEGAGGATTATEVTGDVENGKRIFASAGCGSCHSLEEAGTSGTVGPNLDESQPSYDLIVERVTNGKAPMPSFEDQLSADEIADVAAFVYEATHD